MQAFLSCLAAVLVVVTLAGCGNFLGRVGEQMTDQPEKERAQARAVK
jgi:hypothetical protein